MISVIVRGCNANEELWSVSRVLQVASEGLKRKLLTRGILDSLSQSW